MASLRDKVEAALEGSPLTMYPGHAEAITDLVFETMADQRPCVTCGKGLGPAKVAKGYVQCYDCVRLGRPVS